MTFAVFKGSRELLYGLPTAEACDVALEAARLEPGPGEVRALRSDGALMVHDQDGALVPEADWRARFMARARKLQAELDRICAERFKQAARDARREINLGRRIGTKVVEVQRDRSAVAVFDARRAAPPPKLERAPAPRRPRPPRADNPCGQAHAQGLSCGECQGVERRMREAQDARAARASAPWRDARPFDPAKNRRTG